MSQRTVRLLERAGANAIQIEDQDFPKRCGHLDDKALDSGAGDGGQDQSGRRCARVRAKRSSSPAPTPSPVEGFERAMARAERYREAGADMLFVEAPRQRDELGRIGAAARQGRAPLMANMVEGGKTPMLSASELEATRLLAGDLSGRHRARARQGGRGFLRAPQDRTAAPIRSARACSTSTRSTS